MRTPALVQTALVLIGFQKDYFDPEGALYSVVEESHRVSGTLEHTIQTIDSITESPITIVNTPIVFSETYKEIENKPARNVHGAPPFCLKIAIRRLVMACCNHRVCVCMCRTAPAPRRLAAPPRRR